MSHVGLVLLRHLAAWQFRRGWRFADEAFGVGELGRDLSLDDLRRHYDAFIVASGAATGRRLGIEGEDLPGSFSATDFVSWYCGHPDCPQDMFTTKELRELGELANADVIVHPAELQVDEAGEAVLRENPAARRNLDILRDW